MIHILIDPVSATKAYVRTTYYGEQPDIPQDAIQLPAEPPMPEIPEGQSAVLCYNPESGELFYDYVDRPKTESERAQAELQTRLDEQQAALNEITLALAHIFATGV